MIDPRARVQLKIPYRVTSDTCFALGRSVGERGTKEEMKCSDCLVG